METNKDIVGKQLRYKLTLCATSYTDILETRISYESSGTLYKNHEYYCNIFCDVIENWALEENTQLLMCLCLPWGNVSEESIRSDIFMIRLCRP